MPSDQITASSNLLKHVVPQGWRPNLLSNILCCFTVSHFKMWSSVLCFSATEVPLWCFSFTFFFFRFFFPVKQLSRY